MPVSQLQHINIRCADVEASRHFYVALLGFPAEGPRPPFASQGYWLYLGSEPVVHLVQKRADEVRLGPGTGELDHVAFEGRDLAGMRQALAAPGHRISRGDRAARRGHPDFRGRSGRDHPGTEFRARFRP